MDPDIRRSLKALSELFALSCIDSDKLFRNEEYIAPTKAKAIQRLMVDLCRSVTGGGEGRNLG